MVIECNSRGSKYFVFGDGRWREVDSAEGSVSGWGRVRFVVSRRGKLHIVRRGRILAALRALAAGRRSPLKLGPRLPSKRLVKARRKSRSLSTQTAPVKHCHCCQHVENNRCSLMQVAPGLSMPIIETDPIPVQTRAALADAGVQTSLTPVEGAAVGTGGTGGTVGTGALLGTAPKGTPLLIFQPDPVISSSTRETLADIKLSQKKRGPKRKLTSSEDTSQDATDEGISQSILRRGLNGRFLRSTKAPKREQRTKKTKVEDRIFRPSTVYNVSSDSDVPLIKVADKSGSDVPLVKVAERTTQKPKSKKKRRDSCRELMISELDVAILRSYLIRSFSGFNKRRYDHDASYKVSFFYAINPLVSVERCRKIDRMLERQEQTSVDRFASKLGLRRSVSQTSSPRLRGDNRVRSVSALSPHLRSASASNNTVDHGSSQRRPVTRQSLLSPAPASVPAPLRHSPRVRPANVTATISTTTDSDTDKENFDTSSRRVTRGPIVTPNSKLSDLTTSKSKRQYVETTSVQLNGSINTNSDGSKKGNSVKNGSKKEAIDKNESKREAVDKNDGGSKNNNDSSKNNNNIDASKKVSTIKSNNESNNKNNNDISKKENSVNKSSEGSKKESNVNKSSEGSKRESNVNKNEESNSKNRDRSKSVRNNSDVSKKESTKKETNSNSSTSGKEKQARVELDRIDKLSCDDHNVSDKNIKKNLQNNNGAAVNNKKVVNNNKVINNNEDDIDRELREKIEELDKKNPSYSKEYSSMEDHTIVAWISSGNRASLVNGNRIWRELEPVFPSLAGRPRSWHSLRNRYLRHLLPTLGSMALPLRHQQQLRVAATRGEIKKRQERRNSIFGKGVIGASSRVRSATAPSPPPSPPKIRKSLLSPRLNTAPSPPPSPPKTRKSLLSPRPNTAPSPSPPPSPPRTRKSLRYSEVTRQFAARHRTPSPSTSPLSPQQGPSPPVGTTRSRRLYNPNTAL